MLLAGNLPQIPSPPVLVFTMRARGCKLLSPWQNCGTIKPPSGILGTHRLHLGAMSCKGLNPSPISLRTPPLIFFWFWGSYSVLDIQGLFLGLSSRIIPRSAQGMKCQELNPQPAACKASILTSYDFSSPYPQFHF